MDTSNLTIALWSYGLSALCYFALTTHLLLRAGKANSAEKALAAAVASSGVWGMVGLLVALTSSVALLNIHHVLDVILYGTWYTFLLLLMHMAPGRNRGEGRWLVATGAILVLLGLGSLSLLATTAVPQLPLLRASLFVFLGMVVFGLVLLEQLFRNATADSRWNIKPLGIGLGAVFVFDLYFRSNTLLFNHMDETVFAVRGFVYAMAVPLITLTIFRTRARSLKVALSKNIIFHTTTFAAVGLYLLAASAAGYYVRYWGGSWGGALQLIVVFFALIVLMLLAFSGTVRAKMRVLVGKHFFRYRYDYREEWQKFTTALASENSIDPMGQRVIRGLADMVESPAGTLWLKEPKDGHYVQRARWNLPESDIKEPNNSPLVEFLASKGWVINLEEYRFRPGRYQELTLPEWLTEVPNAWLVIPLNTATEVIGFVVLTTARTPIEINWEVNDLLKTAGFQAAGFLVQMQTTEALLEARKFDAFNRMSAFVVHDLKNIVTQLSLLVKNAEKHRDNPEFQHDMLHTVSHSVERMKQLMLQLREGATPVSGISGVALSKVVQRVHAAKINQFPALELDIRQPVVTRGHEDRIERVIGHLIQNAIEATSPDGRIWVTVGMNNHMAMVEVGDTGKGMSPDFIRERLFKPFQTTKNTGMGIGAHESYQYIQELGGKIKVESTENVGSIFRLTLPLINTGSGSDLQLGKA